MALDSGHLAVTLGRRGSRPDGDVVMNANPSKKCNPAREKSESVPTHLHVRSQNEGIILCEGICLMSASSKIRAPRKVNRLPDLIR